MRALRVCFHNGHLCTHLTYFSNHQSKDSVMCIALSSVAVTTGPSSAWSFGGILFFPAAGSLGHGDNEINENSTQPPPGLFLSPSCSDHFILGNKQSCGACFSSLCLTPLPSKPEYSSGRCCISRCVSKVKLGRVWGCVLVHKGKNRTLMSSKK